MRTFERLNRRVSFFVPETTTAMANSRMDRRFIVVLTTLFLCSQTSAFNLDTEHYTRHGAPVQTPAMFGFTVAAHTEGGQSWIMVGAPEAQTNQPNVTNGGAVYRCDPSRDNVCGEVPFDNTGNNKDSQGKDLDKKSYQWFGATISSGGPDAPFVACAPRYVSFAWKDRRDPVGTCFVAKNGFREILEYAPCRTRNWGYHRQGSCQAGLGAAISKDGHHLYVGAPGSWYWQGQVYSINPSVQLPFMPPRYKQYGEGQVYSHSMDDRRVVFSTSESKSIDDDSYLGYSVAAGYFDGNGEQALAVGMPRGTNLKGKVVLFTNDLQNIQNITGEQLGAYFGYCLCAADVDGDGLDDLVVGAPMYTIPNNEKKFEVGRIYVIYQSSSEGKFQKVHMRDGVNSRSRFGTAVTSLGDINLDGYGDFAVGAPYDGRGAVYIYHGGPDGVREKPSQIIRAEDVYQGSLSTFGFSIAGGADLDNNQYNDLIIGAYESDTVFLFRSKPVVKMMAGVEFTADSNLISLDEKNCTLYGRKKNVTCTNLKYCLIYNGINVDPVVDFNIQIILDTKKQLDPRLFFMDAEGKNNRNITIPLSKNQSYCSNMMVYIKDNIRDKLTPIEAEIRYTMKDQQSSSSYTPRTRNPRLALRPILDQNSLNSQSASINIQKNCGPDNICIPDLRMTAESNVDKYLLGSKNNLEILVTIENTGEDAFEASYNLQLPKGINYVNIERLEEADAPIQCIVLNNHVNQSLKCDIGNPLAQDKLIKFNVLLEPFYKPGMPLAYDFDMFVNSTNPENEYTINNNHKHIGVEIWVETELSVESYSLPVDTVYYNSSTYLESGFQQETEIGPQVVHLYNFKNKGASIVEKAEIFLSWPYETDAGDMLMYVLEQPETTGNIKCEAAQHVNDLGVRLDGKRRTYLDSNSAALKGELRGFGASESGEVNSQSSSSGTVVSGGTTITQTSSHSTYSGGSRVITDEQKKKIDEEEKRIGAETGDGSQIHIERAHQAHATDQVQSGGRVGGWDSNKVYNSGNQGSWQYKETYYGGDKNLQSGGTTQITTANEGSRVIYRQDQGSQAGAGGNQGRQWSNQSGTWYVSSGGSGNYGQVYTDQRNAGTSSVSREKIGSGSASGGSQSSEHWASTGNTGAAGNTIIYNSNPIAGGRNYTYSRSWNSTQVGSGKPIVYHTSSNRTSVIGSDGRVSKTESSTEYYTVGAEGQEGSSFNNRYGGGSQERTYVTNSQSYGTQNQNVRPITTQTQGRYGEDSYERSKEYGNTRYYGQYGENARGQGSGSREQSGNVRYYGQASNEDRAQGGSTRYGSGSYISGGARRYNLSGQQGAGRNYSYQRNWNEGYDGYSSGQGRHAWSTEETVNKDLVNAGSRTYVLNQGSTAGNTYVGESQDPGPLGAAAAGKGFRTSTLDLGVLQSVENSGRSSSSEGRIRGGDNYGQQVRWSTDGTQGGDSKSYESSSSYRWNSGVLPGDNIPPTPRPSEHFRWDHQQRVKRQVSESERQTYDEKNEEQLRTAMKCEGLKCTVMRCVTGPLSANNEIWVAIRSRVNAQTLNKLAHDRQITLASVGVMRVLDVHLIGTPLERPPHAKQAVTQIAPRLPPQEAGPVPLWVVLLSAFAGAVLLLLLIFILYKLGFFKRHRPEAPERQPLNRNGYGHGDEQL